MSEQCPTCQCWPARDHVYPEDDGVIVVRRPIGIRNEDTPVIAALFTAALAAYVAPVEEPTTAV